MAVIESDVTACYTQFLQQVNNEWLEEISDQEADESAINEIRVKVAIRVVLEMFSEVLTVFDSTSYIHKWIVGSTTLKLLMSYGDIGDIDMEAIVAGLERYRKAIMKRKFTPQMLRAIDGKDGFLTPKSNDWNKDSDSDNGTYIDFLADN